MFSRTVRTFLRPVSLPLGGLRGVLLLVALLAPGSISAQVTTVYSDPGYLIAGHATMGYIQANATYNATVATSGNRTIRSTFELIDENGTTVYVEKPGVGQNKVSHVTVDTVRNFVVNKPLALSVDVQIVPDQRLDPSKSYRVRLLSVFDVTGIPNSDLGVTLTEVAGHQYVHFFNGTGVVARMASASVSQKFRVQSAGGNTAAFRISPVVDFYRYDPGAANLAPTVELTCQMTDNLGNDVALAQSVFTVTRSAVMTAGVAGTPVASVNSTISGASLNLQPSSQLDSVTRTYTVSVSLKFLDGTLFPTANGADSDPEQLLDFNGTLRFGSINTTFTSISNAPAYGAVAASKVSTTLTIPAANGRITGQGNTYTFGNGAALGVSLDAAGVAHFTGAGTVAVSGPATDSDTKSNIGFERDNITLSTAGMIAGTLTVTLPPGIGYTSNANTMVYDGSCTIAGIPLQQDMSPLNASLALGNGYLHEESKPLVYQINSLTWSTGNGTLQATVAGVTPVSKADVAELAGYAAKLEDPEAAIKASNNFVFNGASGVSGGTLQIGVDANSNGAVTGTIAFGASEFHPHFPYSNPTDAAQKLLFTGGVLTLQADRCAAGSKLSGAAMFLLKYNRACNTQPDGTSCNAAPDFADVALVPTGGFLYFTPDGGLQCEGSTGNHKLKWGLDPVAVPAAYTHSITDNFTAAGYLMPGSSLIGGIAGTGSTAPDQDALLGVGAVLLSGEDPNHAAAVRPDTPAYQETDATIADYPGVTFRVSPDAKNARSRLAGVLTPEYPLASRAQYYVRYAGVSGIHQAAVFKQPMTLYGYDVTLSTLKFSYLDNTNHGSRTAGYVDLPEPSGFTVDFSELEISCQGGLLSAKVENVAPVELIYWKRAPLNLLSMQFETLNECDVTTPACLVLGVQGSAELFQQKISGEMGFRPTGQIATRTNAANGAPKFDSRLKVPSVKLPGPGRKTYAFTPSQDAYFNDAASAGAPASGAGFLNLFGTVDVPFFQDLKCHVQTFAKNTGLPPLLYAVAGGWTEAGITAFDNEFFDESNRGFAGASTAANYRESSAAGGGYAVHAAQDWLGITDAFRYSLKWDQGGKSFSSVEVSKDFFVFSLTHRAKYLCPDTAEITFGLTYDGLPQINLSGLAGSVTDAAVGQTQNLIDAAGEAAAGTLLGGLDDGKKLLCSDVQALIAPVVDGAILTGIDQMLDGLYALPGATVSGIDFADAADALQGGIRDANSAFQTTATASFTTNATGSMAANVGGKIQAVSNAVGALTDPATGLLQTNGVKSLIRSLVASEAPDFIGVVAGELGGSAVDELLNAPSFVEIRASLGEVSTRLDTIHAKLTNGGTGLSKQLQGALTPAVLQGISDNVADAVEAELNRYRTGNTVELQEIPQARLRELIRQRILDEFSASAVAGTLQTQVREYAQDAVAAATDGFDNGLQQVNSAMRDVIATHLASVDQSISQSVLGPMSDMLGAGRLTGYAHINGDSLTELRVDGKFRWKVPDDLDLEAYLLIRQLDSDNMGGCLDEGEIANEITIGANRVPLEWISPGLSASVGVKFTLLGSEPMGVGGFFDMTGGPLTFEAFKINDMNAALAFGAKHGDPTKAENYLAASTGISIGEWDLSGGLFFGRTCTLDPILLIDSEVASVLGSPPFTGAYVYGEAHLPLNELLGIPSSCMLVLKYGVGAGVFVFAEGPTFGGKFTGEISGEALCVLSISGRMSLIGLKQGLSLESPMRFKGIGTVKGKAGTCPFCVKFKKSIGVTFEVSGGDISSPSIDY